MPCVVEMQLPCTCPSFGLEKEGFLVVLVPQEVLALQLSTIREQGGVMR